MADKQETANMILRDISKTAMLVYKEQGQAADPRVIKGVVRCLKPGFLYINKVVMVFIDIEKGQVPFPDPHDPFSQGYLYHHCLQIQLREINEYLPGMHDAARLDRLLHHLKRVIRFFITVHHWYEMTERHVTGN